MGRHILDFWLPQGLRVVFLNDDPLLQLDELLPPQLDGRISGTTGLPQQGTTPPLFLATLCKWKNTAR